MNDGKEYCVSVLSFFILSSSSIFFFFPLLTNALAVQVKMERHAVRRNGKRTARGRMSRHFLEIKIKK